ncbi:DUF6817 domain-containing protein [Micromonosporaceae bacterium Da 78-11]
MGIESEVGRWLRERGTESIDHPGGTLDAHLGRVHDRLAAHGADADLRLAALTHAAYGTDGFPVTLLDVADRAQLRSLIGERAEQLVYRYGGCDRGRTWRALGSTGTIWSRFTEHADSPSPVDLCAFVDLSIVNELDVCERSAEIADRHGDYFRSVFTGWAGLASPAVLADARRVLDF